MSDPLCAMNARVYKLEQEVARLASIIDAEELRKADSKFARYIGVDGWFVTMFVTYSAECRQAELWEAFFGKLDHFCPPPKQDKSRPTTDVVCCIHPRDSKYLVVEAVVSSDVPGVTIDGIGAALDESWRGHMLRNSPTDNTIEALCYPEVLSQAVHCANGKYLEYTKAAGAARMEDPYEMADFDADGAAEDVRCTQEWDRNICVTHPAFHRLFPGKWD